MHIHEMVSMCAHICVSLDPATDRSQTFCWIEFGIIKCSLLSTFHTMPAQKEQNIEVRIHFEKN